MNWRVYSVIRKKKKATLIKTGCLFLYIQLNYIIIFYKFSDFVFFILLVNLCLALIGGRYMIDYRIISRENYSNKIGELVTMLEHTRDVTLSEISNLSQSDLDFLSNGSSNTIGSLLSHIAAIEFVHQVISFEKRDLTENEYLKWRISLELGDKAREVIKKQSLDYYLNELSQVRENTLTYLKSKQDSWLFEEDKWGNGVPYNNYYLWFHVMEDEINHRGQIRTIKRLMGNNK
ncbi:hypothetical protein bpmyx0001_24240 [Bacillus pseudomycoides DSM 12442]|nr:hypothetical protein bpmyx0001_24240 [Bacillus pseudomycoides DSM 12442]